MSYLKDFLKYIANQDYASLFKIWEEYCSGDELDGDEIIKILKAIKNSPLDIPFGKDVLYVLPLWETVKDPKQSHEIFKLIIDLDNTQNTHVGEKVFEYLQKLYGQDRYFHEKMKLIGFRNKNQYQGSLSNYELLSHIDKNKFMFHTGGWGVGVILDYSLVREQLSLEFDYVAGKKDLSFQTALKTLIPVPDDHFLALRFGNPDALEKQAKENPLEVIRILLRDLGPKTAAEIKDELYELVIPASEWAKWWQNARAKVKKDTLIETPVDLRSPFALRDLEVSHEASLQKALASKPDANTLIQMVYSFVRDFPETLKNESFRKELSSKIEDMLSYPELSLAQKTQIYFTLQDLNAQKKTEALDELLMTCSSAESLLSLMGEIQVLSFKKRLLIEIKRVLPNWQELFLELLLPLDQGSLRDYILTEIGDTKEELVKDKLDQLISHPAKYPDTLVWYFQKIMSSKKVLFSDKQGKLRFFEAFLILLSRIEQIPKHRDLVKKMQGILSGDRYAIVRQLMEEASTEEVKEYLLLSTKCLSLSDHDIKILHSLAEVAHPSLAKAKKKSKDATEEMKVIWTTEQGYFKLKQRIQQIATVETVDNAKEIETARAHGDLRENAEFKAALERRDRLQSELKTLSDQLNQARIITSQDISKNQVGVGAIVSCLNGGKEKVSYTLLGPWDADPEKNILSSHSKLAQAMQGLTVGEAFQFQGETFTITNIESYL